MIKRVSLVWKRPELQRSEFRALWLGEHAELARGLAGTREYVIDFNEDATSGQPDGIATLRFEDLAAVERAFGDEDLKAALLRTRDQFAVRAEVFFVDETIVFRR
jgi:hypothetical protein